ncbi:UDP-4-amino-4,6-dideoxy-N-acetyl-beta-L-altrosamine N-acetyltransferase [Halomonas sp. AOP22-C1-8]|uniref:UDP-4-amino-4, 6-dideoxy-N-acetyl-beta-L-altrosamine N-acetyltransferase n=1 Tax=Halomonas sp. AOP22-C1-8 TaxID=3457717 RepID=UPI0040340DDE
MTSSVTELWPLQEADLELVREWRNHPDVRRFMYTQHEITKEEHRAWFQRTQADPQRHLLLAKREGKPFGFVNFFVLDVTAKRAEWGFYLAPDAESGSGQMLGSTALNHAFCHLALHKLCSEALAYNLRSIRFHERLGFTREAQLRDHHFDGNTYHDVICFGLLCSEWQVKEHNYP